MLSDSEIRVGDPDGENCPFDSNASAGIPPKENRTSLDYFFWIILIIAGLLLAFGVARGLGLGWHLLQLIGH